jgi:hypothetical protein
MRMMLLRKKHTVIQVVMKVLVIQNKVISVMMMKIQIQFHNLVLGPT